MALTNEEIQQVAVQVAEILSASSQGVSEVPVVESVAGIVSLPAIKRVGTIESVVSAPISLLKGKDGREILLRLTDTAIQWQYAGGAWADLITREVLLLPATEIIGQLTVALNAATGRLNDINIEWSALSDNVSTAVAYAIEIASHPTHVGEDNYVYEWDVENKEYVKTSVNVRGERGQSGVQLVDDLSEDDGVSEVVILQTGEPSVFENWTKEW
ncbi:hypothetical protein [Massilibacteroides sp.]|uniref:hypothetical protein n=1 Tax=Massilibacteroides sp. TaxID=2034766 RepID=UPI0026203590|nr:hypothetical protein [Massilibacteroides sp.]MDD4516462.1 hypothetical protein [Massilibacteroides sp.]